MNDATPAGAVLSAPQPATLDPRMPLLVAYFNACDDRGRTTLVALAASLAKLCRGL